MAEPANRKVPPAEALDEAEAGADDTFEVVDADLALKHMRVLVKDYRPLFTVAQWLVIAEALDVVATEKEATAPLTSKLAEDLMEQITLKLAELQPKWMPKG